MWNKRVNHFFGVARVGVELDGALINAIRLANNATGPSRGYKKRCGHFPSLCWQLFRCPQEGRATGLMGGRCKSVSTAASSSRSGTALVYALSEMCHDQRALPACQSLVMRQLERHHEQPLAPSRPMAGRPARWTSHREPAMAGETQRLGGHGMPGMRLPAPAPPGPPRAPRCRRWRRLRRRGLHQLLQPPHATRKRAQGYNRW